MLYEWKRRGGSKATYEVLYDALSHDLVQRRDLVEMFCLSNREYCTSKRLFQMRYKVVHHIFHPPILYVSLLALFFSQFVRTVLKLAREKGLTAVELVDHSHQPKIFLFLETCFFFIHDFNSISNQKHPRDFWKFVVSVTGCSKD